MPAQRCSRFAGFKSHREPRLGARSHWTDRHGHVRGGTRQHAHAGRCMRSLHRDADIAAAMPWQERPPRPGPELNELESRLINARDRDIDRHASTVCMQVCAYRLPAHGSRSRSRPRVICSNLSTEECLMRCWTRNSRAQSWHAYGSPKEGSPKEGRRWCRRRGSKPGGRAGGSRRPARVVRTAACRKEIDAGESGREWVEQRKRDTRHEHTNEMT